MRLSLPLSTKSSVAWSTLLSEDTMDKRYREFTYHASWKSLYLRSQQCVRTSICQCLASCIMMMALEH
ncbi:hypothetical protein ANCCAN_29475 [Ancylostoma caninum]|uniref:Uncharacterized protein n=1 Tax=Ancylostoma caninum TaxID=29170 RepID=A0A368EYD7_ANCCA|nr:hypothetical protein ANCCAN_29475 [Ancylostoma caninum]